MPFRDRAEAGRRLADCLQDLRDEDVVVLGLPRGGVPVAFEVARSLGAPLDVIVVRKLGVPSQPELGMGAIGEDGVRVINDDVVRLARVGPEELAAVERREREELRRRAERFRAGRPRVPVAGRTAVIVDDGVATGATARAACQVALALGARRVVLAVPVAPPSVIAELSRAAADVVCVESPSQLWSVGQWYRDFTQTTDDEVVALLERAAPAGADVEVPVGSVRLRGTLVLPDDASGFVVFAHGSGSSRHSPRNRHVAGVLNRAGLGTLLFDLLTPEEERDRANVFAIALLAGRLVAVTDWVRAQGPAGELPLGLFGASTGAGAALWAAAEPGSPVAAIVSRGGRPDLAGPRLAHVHAPTLLIVGGLDHTVLALNRQALGGLACESELAVVPGATHLFEETGTLDAAAELARSWFAKHLTRMRTVR
jgi:putative phosphoribosyl transferase